MSGPTTIGYLKKGQSAAQAEEQVGKIRVLMLMKRTRVLSLTFGTLGLLKCWMELKIWKIGHSNYIGLQ